MDSLASNTPLSLKEKVFSVAFPDEMAVFTDTIQRNRPGDIIKYHQAWLPIHQFPPDQYEWEQITVT